MAMCCLLLCLQLKFGRTKTVNKVAANESAARGHVDKHGGDSDACSSSDNNSRSVSDLRTRYTMRLGLNLAARGRIAAASFAISVEYVDYSTVGKSRHAQVCPSTVRFLLGG